jgi:hypothetical protein
MDNEQIKKLYKEYKALDSMPLGLSWDNYDDWSEEDHKKKQEYDNMRGVKRDELYSLIAEVGGQDYAFKQATAIADFWCTFLADDNPPIHNVGREMNTVDSVRSQMFSEVMIAELKDMYTTEQIEVFRQSLINLIQNERDNTLRYFTIGVDYDPDRLLQSACNDAGIEIQFCATFPAKTMCYASADIVSARVGYGGDSVILMSCIDSE